MKEEVKIHRLLSKAGVNPNASIDLLKIIVEYFETDKPLPQPLVQYLLKAFKMSINANEDVNGATLLEVRKNKLAQGLGISVGEGRPKAPLPVEDVIYAIGVLNNISETELKKFLAEGYGVSLSTARNRIKSAKAAINQCNEILAHNNITSLVRRREY